IPVGSKLTSLWTVVDVWKDTRGFPCDHKQTSFVMAGYYILFTYSLRNVSYRALPFKLP
ncbi:uncharacterized protein K441DRAFT_667259, partial [Cenococcum geophilum 1.58]|uniref:uncharacterized protein n=1 Tax=Cenococcum geophilum 1.58 TaxID=794803 RepID=UPI00358ED2AA